MPTVNEKGATGVAMVTADLISRGYSVFLPFDGSGPVDLIVADKTAKLARVQVKYRKKTKFDTIEIPFVSIMNGKRVLIDIDKIDGWAIFCPDTALVYYISKSQIKFGKSLFVLSLNRHERSSSRYADDYRIPDIFWSV